MRYEKCDRLRWLSHLEVLRAVERLVRRSGLAFAVTHGFNPHMKLAFGPALPVGTAGRNEYADVWLTRYTDGDAALAALRGHAVPGLAPLEVGYVDDRGPSLSAALTIGEYRIEIDGEEIEAKQVRAGLDKVLGRGQLEVEHKGKIKVFDLGACVPKDARVEAVPAGAAIEFPVRMGPQGSLRPEMLVRAALVEAGIAATAMRTVRTDTLVEADEGVWSRPL
jgi:radical SAM-linked protein